jgi:serine/threonine-protein kinase
VIGTTFGKYLVTGELGRGATGVLYKALDPGLGRDVAVKVLRWDAADKETLRRFRSEAAVLGRLNHPDIVTIYEFLQTDRDLAMVMEFVPGESLEALARRSGPVAADTVAYVVDHVLSALDQAHRFGIVHRDLKPANVMLTNVGGVKVMDFGIARVCAGQRITRHGAIMGTPGYMAPEQIRGEPVDIRADVYAVGAVLYRLLAGVPPFEGDTTVELIQQQLSEVPPPLRTHCSDIPEAYQNLVTRAMAKSSNERFRTADEFREALARASGTLKSLDISRRLARECPTASVLLSSSEPISSGNDAILPTVKLAALPRSTWAAATALVAVVVIAGMLGASHWTRVEVLGANRSPLEAAPSSPTVQADLPGGRSGEPAGDSRLPASVAGIPATATPLVPESSSSAVSGTQHAAPAVPRGAPDAAKDERAPTLSGKAGTSAAISKRSSTPVEPPAIVSSEARSQPIASTVSALSMPAPAPSAASASEPPADVQSAPRSDQQFDAKFLTITDAKPRELDVRLALGSRALAVLSRDESSAQLQTLAYRNVTAVSYSVARDPLWQSEQGPTPVLRRGGMLRRLGVSNPKHWIVLRTEADAFVVLQVNEATAPAVLSLLEENTGLRAVQLTDRGSRAKE